MLLLIKKENAWECYDVLLILRIQAMHVAPWTSRMHGTITERILRNSSNVDPRSLSTYKEVRSSSTPFTSSIMLYHLELQLQSVAIWLMNPN